MKNSVSIASSLAEIQTRYLSSACLECYCYTSH